MAAADDADNCIEAEFQLYRSQLDADLAAIDAIKEASAELARSAQAPLAALRVVHAACDPGSVRRASASARDALRPCAQLLAGLAARVPPGQYYKYSHLWRDPLQQLCVTVAFVNFLEADRLLGLDEAAAELGLAADTEGNESADEGDGEAVGAFHLDLEDYLFGLLCLASELARLSVNSVTAGCPAMPRRVAEYARRLEAGFRLLNFKNDALRRRYDVLKYDMRKIEEVLYDVTVRKLEPGAQ